MADAKPHKLSDTELASRKQQLPGWNVIEVDGIPRLVRVYKFPDFAHALSFTNRVGALAEQEGHHPALLTEWGKVTVSWWTHDVGGLQALDADMASRTDGLYK